MAQRYDRSRNDPAFDAPGRRAEERDHRRDPQDRFQDRFYHEQDHASRGSVERGVEDWQQEEAGHRPLRFEDERARHGFDAREEEWRTPTSRYNAPPRGRESGGWGRREDGPAQERGFLQRASDEVASWMGDDAAAHRREEDHRGKGPRGYQRPDSRIHDDVNDRLSDHPRIDASDIEVSVDSGEVTLSGEVSSKLARRQAEDCADAVSGVRYVQNNLRVRGAPGGPASSGPSGLSGAETTRA